MGNSTSTPTTPTIDVTNTSNNNNNNETSTTPLTCPITGQKSSTLPTNHPMMTSSNNNNQQNQQSVEIPSECPMSSKYNKNNNSTNSASYNVYGQKIDPNNNMPLVPNQAPHSDQVKPLDTQRIESTIRKGGTQSDKWIYPSEQMFFNALKRKGKANGITEEDMEVLLKIHNGTNERAWKLVMQWEQALHACECKEPTLLRFIGKPADLAPKAWIKSRLMGYSTPFDRHDWIVDRCGKEVRYVLDFYYDESSEDDSDMVLTVNEDGFVVPKHVDIDVRPALDNFENLSDRVRFMFKPRNTNL